MAVDRLILAASGVEEWSPELGAALTKVSAPVVVERGVRAYIAEQLEGHVRPCHDFECSRLHFLGFESPFQALKDAGVRVPIWNQILLGINSVENEEPLSSLDEFRQVLDVVLNALFEDEEWVEYVSQVSAGVIAGHASDGPVAGMDPAGYWVFELPELGKGFEGMWVQ